jgi:phosphotransferase system enzyme I (PtsP)
MASADKPLHVMFPFIAQLSELDAAKKILLQERAQLESEGAALPSELRVGVMIEIPSLLWQLPALMQRVDFVSIGSNDLMQFLFAWDRGSPHLAGAYDTLSPVLLKVVANVVKEAAEQGVEVGFCGEMARRPLEAPALIGAGLRSLSVPASSIGPLKAMIRSLDLAELSAYMHYLAQRDEPSLRPWLADYARDHGVVV